VQQTLLYCGEDLFVEGLFVFIFGSTRFFAISAKETDGWILDLFADGTGSSRDRCLFA